MDFDEWVKQEVERRRRQWSTSAPNQFVEEFWRGKCGALKAGAHWHACTLHPGHAGVHRGPDGAWAPEDARAKGIHGRPILRLLKGDAK